MRTGEEMVLRANPMAASSRKKVLVLTPLDYVDKQYLDDFRKDYQLDASCPDHVL
jgi:hypothetical protein